SQHNARQVEKIVYVHEITPEFLTDWMGTWKDRTHYSKGKKRKNINAFFRHCLAQHWIKRNPAERWVVNLGHHCPSAHAARG
ncbi:MAG: hypothetical protein WB607_16700, partial [Candidatus Acidiferrum sp.]